MDLVRKLVSERLRAQAAASHPDADVLAAFVENSLARVERDQVLAHVSDCQECREVLYLSLPVADKAQSVLSLKPDRARRFRWRWATVVALVGMVAAIVTLRYQLLTSKTRPTTAALPPTVSTYAKAIEDLPPSEKDQTRAFSSERKKAASAALDKVRPEFKAMHAKPRASLDFDQSGQVHLRAAQPAPEAFSVDGRSAAALNSVASSAEYAKQTPHAEPSEVARADAREARELPATMGAPMRPAAQTAGVAGQAETVTLKGGTVSTSIQRQLIPTPTIGQVYEWTLSAEGSVLRSSDRGKTWQAVPSAQAGPFAALSSVGAHVWVGGKGGRLFHSADSGQSWQEVAPSAGDRRLNSDISHIEFTDPVNGVVSTADGELWTTADGGLTWRRN